MGMLMKRALPSLLSSLKPNLISKYKSILKRNFILGIETSCDDTGLAILSESGKILGECIHTQKSTRFGGVIQQATGEQINDTENLKNQGVQLIAVTNRPG